MTNTTSSCAAGIIVVMNAFIDPSNTEKYLELTKPIAEEFRKHPENLFTAISVNPTDLGHVRIVHGWTKDSTWFQETFVNNKPWFENFIVATKPMWLKPRIIEHFDRYDEK